ncbi:MAG TPA: TfpX/TfpZ family type IV pilin accessory protein [Steroidobacteraceae bacterium]|nr:TfpX/TfpZ family type IV pilin accessory protein [Steroidobacteraceae bacterium]
MINWREKWAAFGVHFLITLVLSAAAAALVFLAWFPAPFHKMLGGTTLFEIMVLCDLGLGPLSSFIVYNSRKTRRALLFDYTIIAIVQISAFVYGVYAVANNRPAYIVFVGDRFEVIPAGAIDDADLARGGAYDERPWGPQLVAIRDPKDVEEHNQMLFSGLGGKDYSVLPEYYIPFEQDLAELRRRAKPVTDLEQRHEEAQPLVAEAVAELQIPVERLVYMPVMHKDGFWTVLLDSDTGQPVSWLPVDPY